MPYSWKGLIKKINPNKVGAATIDFIEESESSDEDIDGQYRRNNICELGALRTHESKEDIDINWDGFPFDSTMSRGALTDDEIKMHMTLEIILNLNIQTVYPLGNSVDEYEALRRARHHLNQYHTQLSQLNVDHLIDYRTEFEIAGVQLIHVQLESEVYV